jgi:hypothetical protein
MAATPAQVVSWALVETIGETSGDGKGGAGLSGMADEELFGVYYLGPKEPRQAVGRV